MKLSEAIRLGAMMKPQAINDDKMGMFASCALRAAADAVGLAGDLGDDYEQIMETFALAPSLFHCPARRSSSRLGFLCDSHRQIVSVIWHLNDHHRWTREQIADWVETIEQQQPATPEVIVTPVGA